MFNRHTFFTSRCDEEGDSGRRPKKAARVDVSNELDSDESKLDASRRVVLDFISISRILMELLQTQQEVKRISAELALHAPGSEVSINLIEQHEDCSKKIEELNAQLTDMNAVERITATHAALEGADGVGVGSVRPRV